MCRTDYNIGSLPFLTTAVVQKGAIITQICINIYEHCILTKARISHAHYISISNNFHALNLSRVPHNATFAVRVCFRGKFGNSVNRKPLLKRSDSLQKLQYFPVWSVIDDMFNLLFCYVISTQTLWLISYFYKETKLRDCFEWVFIYSFYLTIYLSFPYNSVCIVITFKNLCLPRKVLSTVRVWQFGLYVKIYCLRMKISIFIMYNTTNYLREVFWEIYLTRTLWQNIVQVTSVFMKTIMVNY